MSRGNAMAQKGTTYYPVKLGLPDKVGTIKRLQWLEWRAFRPTKQLGPCLLSTVHWMMYKSYIHLDIKVLLYLSKNDNHPFLPLFIWTYIQFCMLSKQQSISYLQKCCKNMYVFSSQRTKKNMSNLLFFN